MLASSSSYEEEENKRFKDQVKFFGRKDRDINCEVPQEDVIINVGINLLRIKCDIQIFFFMKKMENVI